MNNYEAVYDDHLARIALEKGEKYAKFITGVTLVLSSSDLIIGAIQPEKLEHVGEAMVDIVGFALSGLGVEYGIRSTEDLIAVIKECREILTLTGAPTCEVH